MKRFIIAVLLIIFLLSFSSCNNVNRDNISENTTQQTELITYAIISQSEAKEIIDNCSDYIILDVRTQEEYDAGHIPDAICIDHSEISEKADELLHDKNQLILVYCRTGRRSKIAAQALVDLGYTNVKEFGGITTWEYETVKENTTI